MSWHGGTSIANALCDILQNKVVEGSISPRTATEILTPVIHELLQSDWGDPETTVWAYESEAFVLQAFKNNNVELQDGICSDCEQHEDDHCSQCGECGCEGECSDEDEEYEDESVDEPNKNTNP